MMPPIAITATGMVTSVGVDSLSASAAIDCAIDNFQDTAFQDLGGEWQIGSEVALEKPYRGSAKLLKMAARASNECLRDRPELDVGTVALILCLPEQGRAGRVLDDDSIFFEELQQELNRKFSPFSRILAHGHAGVAVALKHCRELLAEASVTACLVVGVDSLLVNRTLRYFEQQDRLLTSEYSDGFIPGEGASALLLEQAADISRPHLLCCGLGFATEPEPVDSAGASRADGLVAAINNALTEAGMQMHDMAYRVTDLSGEHYYFKEASLALSRTLRTPVDEFDVVHPADCIGEVGAACGGLILAYQYNAMRTNADYSHNVLAHFGDDDGKRTAIILAFKSGADHGE